jgi:hypothetical protein
MTSPAPTPGSPDPDAGAGGSVDPSASASSAPAAPTSAAPPGPLTPDAVKALQGALSAEQAAVWAYGLVAAYARDQAAMIAEARSGHLLRRDSTTARLTQGGATPPEPAAAYKVSVDVKDPASALQLAMDIETDAAAGWRLVIGSTDDPELRGFALAGLSDAAVRLAMWKQVAKINPTTVPFPGQD